MSIQYGTATQVYNDGGIPHGAPLGQISGLPGVFQVYQNGLVSIRGFFKFNGISPVNRPSKVTEVTNPDASPYGSFGVLGFDGFSCDVQCPNANITGELQSPGAWIHRGDTIQELFSLDGTSAETYVCETASQAMPMDGQWHQNTTWKRVYNTGNFVAASQ